MHQARVPGYLGDALPQAVACLTRASGAGRGHGLGQIAQMDGELSTLLGRGLSNSGCEDATAIIKSVP